VVINVAEWRHLFEGNKCPQGTCQGTINTTVIQKVGKVCIMKGECSACHCKVQSENVMYHSLQQQGTEKGPKTPSFNIEVAASVVANRGSWTSYLHNQKAQQLAAMSKRHTGR
jgi:hypothetical protein